MKRIVITAFGGVEVLKLLDAPLPEPGAGETRVRVLCSAVSGADINMRRGTYPMQPAAPLTPGYSIVGIADKNGPGASRFQVGARVACLTVYGGQSEYMVLPQTLLQPVPDAVDPAEAVALILDGMTAYQMITRKVHLAPGQSVFIHGASGAVGALLAVLAKRLGLKAFGTASPAKFEAVRALGVEPFDYHELAFVTEIQRRGGVDAVFDPLGYESFDRSYAMLRRGGVLVGYGFNGGVFSGRRRSIFPSLIRLMLRNLVPDGKRTTFYSINRKSAAFAADQAQLFAWLAAGEIRPPIRKIFTLAETPAAHDYWASGAGVGSLVIRVASA